MSESRHDDELETSVAAWVLGALDEDEAEAIRSHAEACPTCREVEAPASARIQRRRPSPSRPRLLSGAARRMPIYAMAAVAVVALLIGVVIGQVTLRGTQPPAPSQVARFALAGHEGMSGAQATVIDLKNEGVVLVDFRGLPPPGVNRVYEVWLVPAKGSPFPAAVFVPDANGGKVVLVSRSLSGYSVMAVTNEPGPDGSPAPTQQPQLYGNLA